MADKKNYNINKISVVIPARDEEENLGLVLDDLKNSIKEIKKDFEIIVVNDHSKDRTTEIALDKGARLINNDGDFIEGETWAISPATDIWADEDIHINPNLKEGII